MKEKLLGSFELLLFMRRGIKRFATDKKTAIRSFLVPLCLAPVPMVIFTVNSPDAPAAFLIMLQSARMVLTLAFTLSIIFMLSRALNRQQYFFQFVSILNWFTIPMAIIVMPVMIGLLSGYSMDDFFSYAIFSVILSTLYVGFIATYSLRVPWEMGGFIAILCLAIDQTALEIAAMIKERMI